MKLFRTKNDWTLEKQNQFAVLPNFNFDKWIQSEGTIPKLESLEWNDALPQNILPPLTTQEVWAAGVTYKKSQTARMDESDFSAQAYNAVYQAERPEIFFKSTPSRCVGHDAKMKLRPDSYWNVPEPELVLLISPTGKIIGYTAGNDLSSRDIEGENLLYLPQAKMWDTSCSLGPCILLAEESLDPYQLEIELTIIRNEEKIYFATASVSQLNRRLEDLVEFLFRSQSFASGVFLMTGTCLVPEGDFTLHPKDEIQIQISNIGKLTNTIE